MVQGPTDLYTRIITFNKAWRLLRPHKSFSYSLDGFEKEVAASHATREEIAKLEIQLEEAKIRRADADKLSRKALRRVINAVKADHEEGGEDGELYAAMGYVPVSVAISMRSKGRKGRNAVGSSDKNEG